MINFCKEDITVCLRDPLNITGKITQIINIFLTNISGAETPFEKENTEQNSSLVLNLQMFALFTDERPKVPLSRVLTTSSDSAGHKWYNHCQTLEGSIFPSFATVNLRGPSGKENITLSKMLNVYLSKVRPTP